MLVCVRVLKETRILKMLANFLSLTFVISFYFSQMYPLLFILGLIVTSLVFVFLTELLF